MGASGREAARTLKGWKHHMTKQHGGYTSDELNVLNVGAEAQNIGGNRTAGELYEQAGESEFETPAPPPNGAAAQASAPAPAPEPLRVSPEMRKLQKQINEQMEKSKSVIVKAVPKELFHRLAVNRNDPSLELTLEETESIESALNTFLLALGVNWEIEPWAITLKSKFWLLLYPLAVVFFVFARKTAGKTATKPTEPAPETKESIQ